MNLDTLNPMQKEAVLTHDGPLLILAGAGSGKTQTMTYRIAHLIESGVSPFSILAVTFTNKAAKEMKDRVGNLTGDIPGMWIMTFHAMSLRILRSYAERIGFTKNFLVYDTVDTKQLIKQILKDLKLETKEFPVNYLLEIISKQKEKGIKAATFSDNSGYDYRSKKVAEVYLEYEKRLRKNDAMDFDDLLLNCYLLLKNNEDILDIYSHKFKYIMVDEYQDTNMLQYHIIKMLQSGYGNICVVGDDDQCIYEWRGADIRNILGFERDFKDCKVIKLEQNYRSHKYILDAAYSVIKNNKSRKEKRLWTEKAEGEKVLYHRLDDDKEEGKYIAGYIKGEKNRDLSDFAVLYRMNAQSRVIEDALMKAGIPYQVLSGMSFYKRKETKDIISYLRLVYNPNDNLALDRVINEPKRGIGPSTMDKVKALANVNGKSLFEILTDPDFLDGLTPKLKEKIEGFTHLILDCRNEQDNLSISLIYDILVGKSGYLQSLEDENTIEAEGRIENLFDFKSYIQDYEDTKKANNEEASLGDFLELVSISSEQDGYDKNSPKVTLMTLHSAKGLEFPVVFIPGMNDGIFPGQGSLYEEAELEEERRLCYVGFTRAKEKLILTSCDQIMLYGRTEYYRESTFLRELDPATMDRYGDGVLRTNGRTENRVEERKSSFDGFSDAPYVPFRTQKEEIKAVNKSDNVDVGDNVTHPKFGHGIVTDVNEQIVEVKFDEYGIKKLAKSVAPLKRV